MLESLKSDMSAPNMMSSGPRIDATIDIKEKILYVVEKMLVMQTMYSIFQP